MNDSSGDRNPVELLAEEFIARKRRGEMPTLSEYTDKYPALAAEIRDLFPALLMMEDLGDSSGITTGPHLGGGGLTVTQLGDYRLLREVGRGGMGVVFEAEQVSLGRRVALKVLPAHALQDDQQVRRFEREARAAAKLHHTNIVPVFGVGRHEDTHFYVMQFIQGLGLDGVLLELRRLRAGKARPDAQANGSPVSQVAHSLISDQFLGNAASSSTGKVEAASPKETTGDSHSSVPRLPEGSDLSTVTRSDIRYWRSVARIGVQVAEALEHAHSQGILHRDIKPSNLLMDMKGTVWVTDFGLAKAREEDALTETGDVVGTLRYMAPERFRIPGDARSDVYSLGLTLYEMLALRPAFNQRDRPQLMQEVLHAEPPKLRALNRAIPRDLETIVHKAIAEEPRQRYARAADLAADLARFLEDRPILARRVGTLEVALKWTKRRPAVAALLALVLMVSFIGLGAFAWQYADALQENHNAKEQARLKDLEAGQKELALRQKGEALHQAETHARDAHQKELDAQASEKTALKNFDRLQRTLLTAQLVRAGVLAPSDPESARDLLEDPEACPPAMRDFSWGFYYGQSKRDRWALPTQTGSADNFALSADGKTLATHYDAGAVTVWDFDTGKVRVTLQGSWSDHTFLLLSPDGKVLYTCTRLWGSNVPIKTGLERWDTASGRSLGMLLPRVAQEVPPVLSPDGRWLAAVGDQLKVWEVSEAGCREYAAFKVEDVAKAKALALADDGQTVALAMEKQAELGMGIGGDLVLWDVAAKKERLRLDNMNPVGMLFSRDGKVLYTASGGGATRWDATTGERLELLEPAAGQVSVLTLSADNKVLVGSGPSSGATVWDLQTGKVRTFLRSARAPLILLPDGVTLLSLGTEGAIRLWNLYPEAARLVGDGKPYYDRAKGRTIEKRYTPDGKYQVVLPIGASVGLYDTRTGQLRGTVSDLPRQHEVLFSPDSKTMAVLMDGSVRLCDAKTGKDCGTFATMTGALAFSPSGSYCVAEVGPRVRENRFGERTPHNYVDALKIWDLAAGREVALLKEAQGPVVFSPDGKLFAAVEGGPRDPKDTTKTPRRPPVRVKVWETATGWERATIDSTEPVVFSPDGSSLLVRRSNASTLVSWDLAADRARFTLEDVNLHEWSPGRTKLVVDDTKNPAIKSAPAEGTRQGINVVFSPDGKLLAAASWDGSVILWDADKGTETRRLQGHTGPVLSMAFTADGKTLATSGQDRTVRLWEVSTGRALRTLRGHTRSIVSLSFSADETLLVSREDEASVKVWDVGNGREFLLHGGPPSCVAAVLSPDGKMLATASGYEVQLWDAASGELLGTLEGHTATATTLTFSADSQTLTSENAIEVKQWNVKSCKETTSRLKVPSLSSITGCLLSPDGRTLMVREDDVLILRDLKSGEQRGRIEGVTGLLVFSPDGNRFTVEAQVPDGEGGLSPVLRLWDTAAGRELAVLEGAPRRVVFSAHGKTFASIAKGPAVVLWDTTTGRERGRLAGTWAPISLSPSGDLVLVWERDKGPALWYPASGKAPKALPEAMLPAAFSPDGKTLAACGPEFAVQLWDVAGDKPTAKLKGHDRAVDTLVFAPDGRTLLSTSRPDTDSTLKLWNVADRRERASMKTSQIPDYLRGAVSVPPLFTPDGKTVLWRVAGMLKRLEVETGKEVPAPADLQNASVVAVSPDCRTFVIARGGDLVLADAGTGQLRPLVGTSGSGRDGWFTTDGKNLIHGLPQMSATGIAPMSSRYDSRFQVFDVVTGKEVAAYCLPLPSSSHSTGPIALDRWLQVRQGQSLDPSLLLVDSATGRQLGTLEAPVKKEVGRVNRTIQPAGPAAFSPDGKVLATVDATGVETNVIRLWDIASGTLRQTLQVRQQFPGIRHLMFGADGQRLFALTGKELHRCDLATGKIESVALPLINGQAVAVRSDGKLAAYANAEEVRLFDVEANKTRTLAKLANVASVKMAPDDRSLVVGVRAGNQREMHVFDLNGEKELWSVKLPAIIQGISLAFSADGRTLATHATYDTIKLWDLSTGKARGTLPSSNSGAVALAPDGKSIALATKEGQLSVREVATGKELHALPLGQYSQTTMLQFSPDGKTLFFTPNTSASHIHFALWSPAAETLRFFPGPTNAHALAISPDGKRLAFGGSTTVSMSLAAPLTVLDAATNRQENLGLWELGHVVSAFSPDGKLLAFAGNQGHMIRLWDFDKHALRSLQRGHTGGVLALAFSPDGKTLASGGVDQTVRLWNVAEGKETAVLKGLTVNAKLLGFSPDSKTLVSAAPTVRDVSALKTTPGEVKVWDVATAKQRSGFSLGNMPGCLALSPDAATLAMAGNTGKVIIWDVFAAKERITLADSSWIFAVAFSPDGKSLATSGQNAKPRLWDWAAGVEHKDHFGSWDSGLLHAFRAIDLAFSADGKTLYMAGDFHLKRDLVPVPLWHYDVVTGKELGPVTADKPETPAPEATRSQLVATALSGDGRTLVTAWSNLVDVWDLTTKPGSPVSGRIRTTLRHPSNFHLRHLLFRADGKVLATGDYANNVYLWDAPTGRQLAALKFDSGPIGALMFSPDGKWLVVAAGKEIRLFDAETGGDKRLLSGHRAPVGNVTFRADSGALLSRATDGEVKLWDLAADKEPLTITGRPTPLAIHGLEPDGKTVVTRELKTQVGAAPSTVVRRWDLATGREVGQPEVAASTKFYSPDDSVRLAVEFDASIRFLDPVTSQERLRLPLNTKMEDPRLIFSADGERVAVVGTERSASTGDTKRGQITNGPNLVQIWDWPAARLLVSLRGYVGDSGLGQPWNGGRQPLLVFSRDDRFAALLEQDAGNATSRQRIFYKGDVRVFNLITGKEMPAVKSPDQFTSLAFSSDGKVLATGDWGKVHLWDVATGKELRTLANHPGQRVHAIGFAMEDSILVLYLETPRLVLPEKQEESFELTLWDLATDQARTSFRGARLPAAISPNGRCVAAVGSEGTNWGGNVIQVWDAFTGQQRAILRGHRGQVHNLWFTPDGEALLSQGGDGTLRWQAAWPDLAEQQYLQGTALLWKAESKLQPFHSNDKLYPVLIPAAKCFTKALEIRSNHQGAYAGLARVVEAVDKVPGEDHAKMRSDLLVLLRQVERTCHDRAEAHFVLATALDPYEPAEALEQLRQAISRDAKHAGAYARAAAILLRLGQEEEALTVYRQLLKIEPDHAEANRRAGELLLQKGAAADAVPLLRKLVEVKPDGPGYYLLARALELQGQTDDALTTYEKAASFGGTNALPDLARLLEHHGRWADAVAVHRRRVAAARNDVHAQSDLAYALRRDGQMADSLAAYRRSQELGWGSWIHGSERWAELEKKLPDGPTGKVESTDGDELLALANLSLFKPRTPTAARLYAAALAAKPKLIDSERYNAACAAALAGTDADKEAAALNERDKARWRQQALDWLHQELERRRKSLTEGPAERPWQVQEALGYWRHDPDLFGVLDPAHQAAWPQEERTAWSKFWADADELRRQALVLSTGHWRVEGDELIQPARIKAPCWLTFGDPKWTDYVFELEALREEGGHDGFGVGVRMADADNHCLANFGGWTNRLHGYELTKDGRVYVATQAGSIEAGRWYKVRIEVRGDSATVFLDGKQLFVIGTADNPRGGVGLRSWDTVNRFRNLKVSDLQGKVLFMGQPPLPAAKKP